MSTKVQSTAKFSENNKKRCGFFQETETSKALHLWLAPKEQSQRKRKKKKKEDFFFKAIETSKAPNGQPASNSLGLMNGFPIDSGKVRNRFLLAHARMVQLQHHHARSSSAVGVVDLCVFRVEPVTWCCRTLANLVKA